MTALPTIHYSAALRLAPGESAIVGPVSKHWRKTRDLPGCNDCKVRSLLVQDPETGEGQKMLLITRSTQ